MPTIPGVSNQGFTHQEMIDEVSDQVRDVKIANRITRWLNLEIIELARRNWPFLYNKLNFTIVGGNQDYELSNTVNKLISLHIPSIPRMLYRLDEKFLDEEIPGWRTLSGDVTGYILHDRKISLFRIPATGYTAEYTFYRYPLYLVNPSDISDYPVEFHPLIIQGAIVRGFRYEGNSEQLQEAEGIKAVMQREIFASYMRTPSARHVLGSPEYRNMKPRTPQLPSNYPRS